MATRGVVKFAAQLAGSPDDLQKASAQFPGTERDTAVKAVAKSLISSADLYCQKKLDMPKRGNALCNEALEAIALLPQGKDPDEYIRADPEGWPAALEASVPLVEYFLTQVLAKVEDSPTARARALQEDAVPILREIGDPVVLSHYIAMTARLIATAVPLSVCTS